MAAASSSQAHLVQQCVPDFTLVHSGAKTGLCEHSNLYSGKEIEYDGLKYWSAEAIFQSLKCKTGRDRFAIGGIFSDPAYVLPRVNEGRSKQLSLAHWEKKSMMGVLAKWVIRRPYLFGIEYEYGFDSDEFKEWTTAQSTWFPIFEAKFADPDMLNLLLKTTGQIVEFDRFAKEGTKWGGKVLADGTVIGRNIMGRLLTAFRDSKRPKRKREEEQSEPVKVAKVMTLAKVISAAFKKAEEQGTMIELDQDLPDGWDDMDAVERATYAYSNNWTHAQWQEHLPGLAAEPKPSAPPMDVAPLLSESSDYLHEPNANGGIAPVVPAYDPTVPAGAAGAAVAAPPSPPPVMSAPDAMGSPPWQEGPQYMPESPPYSPSSPAYSPSSGAAKSSGSAASSGAASSAASTGLGAESMSDDEPIDCTAICVTFSDAVESDRSGLAVGEAGNGFSHADLEKIRAATGLTSQMYRVHGENNGGGVTGHVLVLRSALPTTQQSVFDELCNIPRGYIDTKMWSYGSCKNKSRWNTNPTDNKVKGDMGNADPALRHPSQFPFSELPQLSLVRRELTRWGRLTGITGLMNMIAEVNYYGITPPGKEKPTKPPGIGWHIDGERNKVCGVSAGRTRKLCLAAYDGVQPSGPVTVIKLYPGDVYFFDTIASGTTYRGPHIRHCASAGRGNRNYLDQLDKALYRKLLAKRTAMTKAGKNWDTTPETDRILSGQARTIQNILC